MKIAIVGSEGYLGSALCDSLGGHDLLRIDAGVWREPAEGVVRERTSTKIRQRIERYEPDHLVLLSALAHDPCGLVSEMAMHENTCSIPALLAIHADCPTTLISSLSVFSKTGAYPFAKTLLEQRVFGCTSDWRRRVNIFRFGTLFGPSRPEAFRPHLLLNQMTASAIKHGRIAVSNPALRRPVLHIRTAVTEIIADIVEDRPRGQVINCLEHCDTLAGFARIVGETLGCPSVEDKAPDLDERDYGWGVRSPLHIENSVRELATWLARNDSRINHNAMDNLLAWHAMYYS